MRRVSGHGYTFRVDKHLHSEDFFIEDYYFRAKSSPFRRIRLQGLFSRGGCIPVRKNPFSGIIFPRRKHPCSKKSPVKDYFPKAKASLLREIPFQGLFSRGESILLREFPRQGLFSPDKIIPIRKNLPPGMLWEYKSIRHGRKSKLKMHGNRKQLPVSAKHPKAISGYMATGNSIQKAAIAADEITNKVPRTPVSSIFIRACRSARFSFVICPL